MPGFFKRKFKELKADIVEDITVRKATRKAARAAGRTERKKQAITTAVHREQGRGKRKRTPLNLSKGISDVLGSKGKPGALSSKMDALVGTKKGKGKPFNINDIKY